MLIPTVLLASVASLAGGSPGLGGSAWVAPMWASYLVAVRAPWRVLQPTLPCGRLKGILPLPCSPSPESPDIAEAVPALPDGAEVALPSAADELGQSQGGFVNFDVMAARHLVAGPELSWLTPESPREDLLRLRVLTSGWGIRYSWAETGISAGIAICTRFVKMGEIDLPVVDMLTSEARIELALP